MQNSLFDLEFDSLNLALAELGIELKSGQIIDATFVQVPIQRNGRENNAIIKAGAVPIEWGVGPRHSQASEADLIEAGGALPAT